jgi:hypothetical protein
MCITRSKENPMKRASLMAAVLAFGSTFASVAVAQPRPPASTHQASPLVTGTSREDRWDARQVQALRDRFAVARRRLDRAGLRSVEADLQRYLALELRETHAEAAEVRADERRSVREAGAYPRGADRADVREARAEVRQESRELTRLRAIDRELKPLYGRHDRVSLSRKDALLGELVQLAKREVRQDRK